MAIASGSRRPVIVWLFVGAAALSGWASCLTPAPSGTDATGGKAGAATGGATTQGTGGSGTKTTATGGASGAGGAVGSSGGAGTASGGRWRQWRRCSTGHRWCWGHWRPWHWRRRDWRRRGRADGQRWWRRRAGRFERHRNVSPDRRWEAGRNDAVDHGWRNGPHLHPAHSDRVHRSGSGAGGDRLPPSRWIGLRLEGLRRLGSLGRSARFHRDLAGWHRQFVERGPVLSHGLRAEDRRCGLRKSHRHRAGEGCLY